MKITNAKIESTMLGYEDHEIMTYFIYVDYGDGGHQGFGGFALDTPVKKDGKFVKRAGISYGMESVIGILNAVGVKSWEKLKNKYIRVKLEEVSTFNNKIIAIGHITEDKWFDPGSIKNVN